MRISSPLLWLLAGACLSSIQAVNAAQGLFGERELAVYSLEQYGTQYDVGDAVTRNWKSTILIGNVQDPYEHFWSLMYGCSNAACAYTTSARFEDSDVTVDRMLSSGNSATDRGWDSSDLVVFYGHNTQIQPQADHSFKVWRPQYLGYWGPKWKGGPLSKGWPAWDKWMVWDWQWYPVFLGWHEGYVNDWREWGTADEPYRYHRKNPIDDASLSNAYAVFYAYNPLTSVLVGKDFTAGTWKTENTWNQSSGDSRSGKLGDGDLEWLVAHGCNAITVADEDGATALSLGVNAWKKSWGKLHLALGHYHSLYTIDEPDLSCFATDLKSGDTVKNAYFDTHTCSTLYDGGDGHQAAIAVSKVADCCYWASSGSYWVLICPPQGCAGDFLHDDRWYLNHQADLASGFYYVTEWVADE